MKILVYSPGKAGALSAYLNYLFLRFPGTLGPEEALSLECFDTYDRRWAAQRQVWIRRGGVLKLVAPPSLFPLETDPSAFGLQAPVALGKVSLKVRTVAWDTGEEHLEGQAVKAGKDSFLILKESSGPGFQALVAALEADGLSVLPNTAGWWVKDKPSGFLEPTPSLETGPEESAPNFLVAHLKEGLKTSGLYEDGIRDDVDTECLHQYRVNLRRVRSLASLGYFWQVVPEWSRLKNLLRILQQRTNELRDLDVLLLDLPSLQRLMPWNEGAGLETWKVSLEKRRKAEFRRVKTWLVSEEYRNLLDEVGRLLDDLVRYSDPCTLSEWSHLAFGRSIQGLKKALKTLGPEPADEALHELRIRTKRLRYVLDTLGFLGSRSAVKTLVGQLKQSQEGLGQFQDRSVLLDRLKAEVALVRSGPQAVDPLALGMLIGTLAASHGAQKALALADAQQLGSRPFRKALDQLLPQGTSNGP